VARCANASVSISKPSVSQRIAKIYTISSRLYGINLMIRRRSSKSTGIPWGDFISVPLISQTPLLVARMTIGAKLLSRALFMKVKHSISSMWTSSTKRTPGTSSAIPWSIYLFTTLLISKRSFSVISVFFGLLI